MSTPQGMCKKLMMEISEIGLTDITEAETLTDMLYRLFMNRFSTSAFAKCHIFSHLHLRNIESIYKRSSISVSIKHSFFVCYLLQKYFTIFYSQ